MEKRKTPLSINVIYWFTTIVLGLTVVAFLLALVFNVLLYTDFFGNDIQLHSDLPGKVDYLEPGVLHVKGHNLKVELVEASARIHLINTPKFITRRIGIVILLIIAFGYYLTWVFRKFIKNVKTGRIFTIENIALLKKFAYALTGLWIFIILYMRVAYYLVSKHLEFENIRITAEFSNYPWLLFSALFIWVLAHILMTGVRLQEDQDLTI